MALAEEARAQAQTLVKAEEGVDGLDFLGHPQHYL
jgi:hypothetical protein